MSKEVLQLKSAEFIPLSEVRSLVGQPLKIEIPQGKITREGIEAILEYLKASYPGVELPCPNGTTFFQWIWLDPKEGTLPKRMTKWLKKHTRTSPDQKVIAHVGNLARQNSDDSQASNLPITGFDTRANAERFIARNGRRMEHVWVLVQGVGVPSDDNKVPALRLKRACDLKAKSIKGLATAVRKKVSTRGGTSRWTRGTVFVQNFKITEILAEYAPE